MTMNSQNLVKQVLEWGVPIPEGGKQTARWTLLIAVSPLMTFKNRYNKVGNIRV